MNKNQSKKPSQLRAFLSMTYYSLRAQTRNPATFAFSFLFPIVFISIFGLIGNTAQKLTIGVSNTQNMSNQIVQTVKKQSFIALKQDSQDSLAAQLKQGKIDAILSVTNKPKTPSRYQVTLTTSSANPQTAASVTSFISGVVDKTNLSLAGVTNPPITFSQQEISGRQSRYIDFVLPGMIGFSLLSTAIFSVVFGFIFLKKELIFKRMFATPTTSLTILLSQGTSRLIVALAQTILILAIGVFAFKFYLLHGWITFADLLLLSAIGLLAFMGFGLLIAGFAHDENGASPLANLVTLPQFLLSGVFFPIDSLPKWVQPVANNLPLSYFNLAIRKVTTEGGTLSEAIPLMLGLIVWGIVMYLLAAKTFKWE